MPQAWRGGGEWVPWLPLAEWPSGSGASASETQRSGRYHHYSSCRRLLLAVTCLPAGRLPLPLLLQV